MEASNIVRSGHGAMMLDRRAVSRHPREDLARLDRKRKGSSRRTGIFQERPRGKIAKMKDGTTHLAYKPEHAVDLDTGAVVAAELEGGQPDPGGGRGKPRWM